MTFLIVSKGRLRVYGRKTTTMLTGIVSRLIVMVCGMLYPAYASYKAVKNKDVREYIKWMMYWIVFALFTCVETFADIFISFWLPFYYELKILFVLWLLSPATMGSSILYRRFVHPQLMLHEPEIDELIARAKDQGYTAVMQLGSRGLSYAASVVVQTAIKGQEVVAAHLHRELAITQSATAHGDQPDSYRNVPMDIDNNEVEPVSRALNAVTKTRKGQSHQLPDALNEVLLPILAASVGKDEANSHKSNAEGPSSSSKTRTHKHATHGNTSGSLRRSARNKTAKAAS